MRALLTSLLLLASGAVGAQCQAVLQAGNTVTVNQALPANALTDSLCIDVPAGVERLTLSLTAANLQQDVDLLVRIGSPFVDPANESLGSLSTDELFERAHYFSGSAAGDEFLTLSTAGRQPLRAGRLFILLINFSNAPAGFSVGSSIGSVNDFVPLDVTFSDPGNATEPCDLSGWNDPEPRTPIRGNAGTTLGEQRRIAVLEAARLMGESLRPAGAIRMQACWASLEFGDSGGVLAQAGPRLVVVDDPGRGLVFPYLDQRHALQFTPAANHQAGTSGCRARGGSCSAPSTDIRATFNLAVDAATIPSRRFDYGLTPPVGASANPSFVAVALHEVTHGMGFIGLIGLGGSNGAVGARINAFGQPYDDAYGRFVEIIASGQPDAVPIPFLRASDAERASALVSGNLLRFNSQQSINSPRNSQRNNIAPFNGVQLHAPATISSGSSYSHLGSAQGVELMLASAVSPGFRTLGLAGDMLEDIGYGRQPKAVPIFPLPSEVQYFDVTRNGHGIDFRRVAGSTDLHFLGFYSYDTNGNPEWYTSLGRVVDGVFIPPQSAEGDSLQRFIYSPGPPPVSTPDNSPGFRGEMRIDFVDARRSPICQTASERRSSVGTLALMSWRINNEMRQWCMQALLDPLAPLELDLSSVWFNPADPGWGITVQSFRGNGGDGAAIGVFYSDASGRGRWGIVQTDRFVAGQTYPVQQVIGYCRAPECATPANLSLVTIGTLQATLRPAAEGPSFLTLDVTYPGPEGGRFQRTNAPLSPLNTPRFRGN